MLMSVERSCVPVVDSRDDPVTVYEGKDEGPSWWADALCGHLAWREDRTGFI
jgi:hypothetical protein